MTKKLHIFQIIFQPHGIKFCAVFLLFFLSACVKPALVETVDPEVFVSSAYLQRGDILVNCESLNPGATNKDEFGICWANKPKPSVKDNYQFSGSNSVEDGPYSEYIKNVDVNKVYYIRAYIRLADRYIYSEDFVLNPKPIENWTRLEDLPRDDNQNLPMVYARQNVGVVARRKILGFEQMVEYIYQPFANFWLSPQGNTRTIITYDQFIMDIGYSERRVDIGIGAGYVFQDPINRIPKYVKNFGTTVYPILADYPGADAPAEGFGAGNKGLVIEIKNNPNLWAFELETFSWTLKNNPPLRNFTNIKATSIGPKALIVLENENEKSSFQYTYIYNEETDSWLKAMDFPGPPRKGAVLFSLNEKAYYGLGQNLLNGLGLKDLWEFDINRGTWLRIADYPGSGSIEVVPVRYFDNIYMGLGYGMVPTKIGTTRKFQAYDFWRFNPRP